MSTLAMFGGRWWERETGNVEWNLYLPLVKVPDQSLELELRDAGEVDRVCVGSALDGRGASIVSSTWQ